MSSIHQFDTTVIRFAQRWSGQIGRLALATIYIWFGALKVFGASPATAMVLKMQSMTVPFIAPDLFMVLFGFFEVAIGLSFLIPRMDRLSVSVMAAHMVMTMLPLILLPHMVWTGWFVPTLEGQYIIKNAALIAVALSIAARMRPLTVHTVA